MPVTFTLDLNRNARPIIIHDNGTKVHFTEDSMKNIHILPVKMLRYSENYYVALSFFLLSVICVVGTLLGSHRRHFINANWLSKSRIFVHFTFSRSSNEMWIIVELKLCYNFRKDLNRFPMELRFTFKAKSDSEFPTQIQLGIAQPIGYDTLFLRDSKCNCHKTSVFSMWSIASVVKFVGEIRNLEIWQLFQHLWNNKLRIRQINGFDG